MNNKVHAFVTEELTLVSGTQQGVDRSETATFGSGDKIMQICIDAVYSKNKPPDICNKYKILMDKYNDDLINRWKVTDMIKNRLFKMISKTVVLMFVNLIFYFIIFSKCYDRIFKSVTKIVKSRSDYTNVYSVGIGEVNGFFILVSILHLFIHLVQIYIYDSVILMIGLLIELIIEIYITWFYYPFMHNLFVKEENGVKSKVELSFFDCIVNFMYWLDGSYDLIKDKYIGYRIANNTYVKARVSSSVSDTENNGVFKRILDRIFNSNEVSKQLVKDIKNLVIGSLFEYAERFVHWNEGVELAGNFEAGDRSINYQAIDNLGQNWDFGEQVAIINDINTDCQEYIHAIAKIIFIVSKYIVDGTLNGMTIENVNEGSLLKWFKKKYTVASNKKKVCLDGKIYPKTNFIVEEGKVLIEIVSLDQNNEQLQAYSTNLSRLATKAKKIKGKIEMSCEDYVSLARELMELENNITFYENSKLIPHSHSHYRSKVMHIRQLNKMIEVDSDYKILDVGSSFSDITLGNGVEYNIANVENQDTDRIESSMRRIVNYLKFNQGNIVVYVGDVTTFDFSETRINQVLLHNCCYNIDLVKMIAMLEKSGIERMVNSTQVPLNVVKGFDCDNSHNEMQWTVVEGKNESTLSTSNVKVQGVTDVSFYEHNLSTLSDWFTKCSVVMKYLNHERYWNQETLDSFYGYYVHSWVRSDVCKQKGLLRDNDSYMDLMYLHKDIKSYSATYASRSRLSSVHDLTFYDEARDKNRSQRANQIRSHITNLANPATEITTIQNTEWTALYWYGRKLEQLIYRLVNVSIDQEPAFIKLPENFVDVQREIVETYTEDEMDLQLIITALINNDSALFRTAINREGLKGSIIFEVGEEYYLVNIERKVHNKIRVINCNSFIPKVVDFEEKEREFKQIPINNLFNLCLLSMVTSSVQKDERYDRKKFIELVSMIRERKMCQYYHLTMIKEVETEEGNDLNEEVLLNRHMLCNKVEHERDRNRMNRIENPEQRNQNERNQHEQHQNERDERHEERERPVERGRRDGGRRDYYGYDGYQRGNDRYYGRREYYGRDGYDHGYQRYERGRDQGYRGQQGQQGQRQGQQQQQQVNQVQQRYEIVRPPNLNQHLVARKRNVKTKEFALEPWMHDMNVNEVSVAIKTGKAAVNHINCCCVVNLDSNTYYDPFGMLNLGGANGGMRNIQGINQNINLPAQMEIYRNPMEQEDLEHIQQLPNNGIYVVILNCKKFIFNNCDLISRLVYENGLVEDQRLGNIEM